MWKQPHVPAIISQPALAPAPAPNRDQDWLLGEALTNLLVGLGREQRGEKLSTMRFIQGYAVDRILELAEQMETARPIPVDPFTKERRFEGRYPEVARRISAGLQGYEHNRASAQVSLRFLETYFPVNREIAAAIRKLAEGYR